MKLQAHVSRKVNDKTYVKHVIVIPTDTIEKLGWNDGKNINYKILGNRLILS